MTDATDAIILAGGNGSRLKGIAATGMKPLLVVNGEALISRLVRQVRQHAGGNTIVVTSPANTAAICDLINDQKVQFVVQPEPRGPGEALIRGIEAARTNRLLILMGDNWMEDSDIANVANASTEVCVGTMAVGTMDAAKRFTRIRFRGDGLESEEGPEVTYDLPCAAWCGPLVLPKKKTVEVLWDRRFNRISTELKIGPFLSEIARGVSAASMMVKARDIGIPEELL